MSSTGTEPTRLWELAALVRSKNAGPFMLTIDIMFDDREHYERVRRSGVVTRALIAELYDIDPDAVHLTVHFVAMAIKVSFPRHHPSGAVRDTDVFGGQFHGPLVELEIPPA